MTNQRYHLESLGKKHSLWILFTLAIALIIISEWAKTHWGLTLLDGVWNPSEGRELLAKMTQDQKSGHIWFTTTLDVVLPLVVAGLFAGASMNAFAQYGRYLAMVPLLAIPMDFSEAFIQVLALTDTLDLLAIKAYTSPVKVSCYLFGLALFSAALIKWAFTKLRAVKGSANA